jgi:hypothetical protein
LGSRDPHFVSDRDSLEVPPPFSGRGIHGVVGVVVVELALCSVCDQPKNTDVQVAHDRAPRGSGTGIDTAIAVGRGAGSSSSLKKRYPRVPSRLDG